MKPPSFSMRVFTEFASPASVSTRHSAALRPRESALALRGRRRAGARLSALFGRGLLLAIWYKREHEHTHVGTQTLHGGQVRDHRAAHSQLGAHASLQRIRRRHPDRGTALHAHRVGLQVPRESAAGAAAEDLPRHPPAGPAEEKPRKLALVVTLAPNYFSAAMGIFGAQPSHSFFGSP